MHQIATRLYILITQKNIDQQEGITTNNFKIGFNALKYVLFGYCINMLFTFEVLTTTSLKKSE
jgi:hypothetical protein